MLQVSYGLTSKVPVGANTTVNFATVAAVLLVASADLSRFGRGVSLVKSLAGWLSGSKFAIAPS